jgi:hypothetical protein
MVQIEGARLAAFGIHQSNAAGPLIDAALV